MEKRCSRRRPIPLLPFFLWMCACAHNQPLSPSPVPPLQGPEYEQTIARNTVKADKYTGFYQTFQADVTILNSETMGAAVRQRAHFLEWDQRQFQMEKEKAAQEASAYAKFFLRFFSPEADYDDLDRPKTIWKTYLEVNGTRFEGTVKKLKDKLIEVKSVYPHMNRFSTPYEITFNIPMTTVERSSCRFTLTSSLGTAEFNFPPLK